MHLRSRLTLRARVAPTSLLLLLAALALAGCGSASSSYSAFTQAKYMNACEGSGSTTSGCNCTLLYAEAHQISMAQLTAAENMWNAGTNDPRYPAPAWELTAAGAC